MGDGIGDFAFWLAVGFLFLGMTLGPIGKGIARLIEALASRLVGGASAAQAEELEGLAGRVQELEGVERRLMEVEERLDFAERLLTSGREPPRPEADTPPEPVDAVG